MASIRIIEPKATKHMKNDTTVMEAKREDMGARGNCSRLQSLKGASGKLEARVTTIVSPPGIVNIVTSKLHV